MASRRNIFALVILVAMSCFAVSSSFAVSNPGHNGKPAGSGAPAVNNVLVIQPSYSINSSIRRALNELGVSYDFFAGTDFSAVNLAQYTQVIVGMDGVPTNRASIAHVAEWTLSGGHLHFFGGGCSLEYAQALNDYLLLNNLGNYCWSYVAGSPHVTVVDPANYLATGLPATYNFVYNIDTSYQTRSLDAAAHVAARNGDGYDMLMWKTIGSGSFDICINTPYEKYYSLNPNDFPWLKQVVSNMVNLNPTPAEPRSWGTVKALYR